MKNQFSRFIEGTVTVAIVLVLFQTITEDLLVISNTAWPIRRFFIFSGGMFDLFFTVEFLIRSWNALVERRFGQYLFRHNGWVDCIASIPLLVFTSGPEILALLGGTVFVGSGAMMGLLKIVKVVRMARVLRLLRLLKIFRRIKFAESVMVQRHTVRIITTVAATLIFSATIMSAIFAVTNTTGIEEAWIAEQNAAVLMLKEHSEQVMDLEAIKQWGHAQPSVLLIKSNNETLYVRENDEYMRRYFGPMDYSVRTNNNYVLWFDVRPEAVSQSRLNLTIFISTLVVVLLIMITYSPHFAISVSDPVNVMARGLRERSYNFEVRIPSAYSSDDIFRLAEEYNINYLPMKERNAIEEQNTSGALDISLDDISDLLKT